MNAATLGLLQPALYIALGIAFGAFAHAVWVCRRTPQADVSEWQDETWQMPSPSNQNRLPINRIRDIQL
jgi:hypothetical protein